MTTVDGPGIGSTTVRRAVVVATRAESLAVVGGLPLAVRAVLALRAAGFTGIHVAGAHQAEVSVWLERRGVGRGVTRRSDDPGPGTPLSSEPALVLAGDVLFEARVLAPVLAGADPGRLQVAGRSDSPDGEVRVAICPGHAVPALVTALDRGQRPLGETLRELGFPDGPSVRLGDGLFVPLDAAHPPAALTAILLDHLDQRAAATDGYLARLIDRHLSRALTRRLLGWPVTPNQITLLSIVVGLAGAAGLATTSHLGRLGGVVLLLVSSVLDGVDGELARARFEQSATGARLDLTGDYVINLATILGLGIGLARQGLSRVGGAAVIVLVAGVAAAMAAMHALLNAPALVRSDDLHDTAGAADGPGLRGTAVTTVVEKLAGRDYLYLVLILALAGRLEWFLYGAAGGSWVFVAGLLAYAAHRRLRAAARTAAGG